MHPFAAMSDFTYQFTSQIIKLVYWQGTLLGAENLPTQGPAVFVANHLGAAGPIGVVCTLPLRFHPWIIADMINRAKAAEYLQMDFVEPTLKIKPPLSQLVARAIAAIAVPLLISLGCIPVTRGHTQELELSLQALIEGKYVLIFPEAPELDLDEASQMRPFLKGFTRLAEMYHAETGESLRFYPVAVHGSRRVLLGAPLTINPSAHTAAERLRLLHQLENKIREMYLGLDS